MKGFLKIIVFLSLAMLFSCEEQGWLITCDDCLTDEPLNTDLEIKLNPQEPSNVVINIYEGNIEDSIYYATFFSSGPKTSYTVSLNKQYSLSATYYESGSKITVVDAARPRVKYSKDQCDDPCYFVYDKVVDLRLKR